MSVFKLRASDLETALGSINALSRDLAVESKDLEAILKRAGSVAAIADDVQTPEQGIKSLQKFLALAATVRSTTRENADNIGTALRSIFSQIRRPEVIDTLKEMGIKLEDSEGRFIGVFDSIQAISEGLKDVNVRSGEFAAITEKLGGLRNLGKTIPLITRAAEAQKALAIAQQGEGSLRGEAAKSLGSLNTQMTQLRENFFALVRDVGQSKTFQLLASGQLN